MAKVGVWSTMNYDLLILGRFKVESLKVVVELLKVASLKIELLKIKSLKVESLKVASLKIELLKVKWLNPLTGNGAFRHHT